MGRRSEDLNEARLLTNRFHAAADRRRRAAAGAGDDRARRLASALWICKLHSIDAVEPSIYAPLATMQALGNSCLRMGLYEEAGAGLAAWRAIQREERAACRQAQADFRDGAVTLDEAFEIALSVQHAKDH